MEDNHIILNENSIHVIDLIRCIIEFNDESTHKVELASVEKMESDIRTILTSDRCVVVLNMQKDKCAGFAFVMLDSFCMNETFGYLNKFYIRKEYRRSGAGRELIDYCTRLFDALGVSKSFTSATGGIKEDQAFINLLTRYGYTESGSILERKAAWLN